MRFCAFLRGVNVNGTSMKMTEVCGVFERAGMTEVSSVLASGNILFSSDNSADDLKKTLERAMSEHFSYDASMFIKSKDEIQHMLKNVPFSKEVTQHLYIFIGEPGIEKLLDEEFRNVKSAENEKAEVAQQNFYWQIEKGNTLSSDFGKILGNKRYKHLVTSRNLNTIEKILHKL